MRSLLVVPAGSARAVAEAGTSGADLLILDLAAGPPETARVLAREAVERFAGRAAVLIRPLGTSLAEYDLAAVMPARPAAIVLPRCEDGADVGHLAARLAVHEADHAIPDGATAIIALATQTPRALFGLGTYDRAGPRLAALVGCGSDDATTRTLMRAGAYAAGVPAIAGAFGDTRDGDGLADAALRAAVDGFAGMLAVHPGQVATIKAAFAPSAEALDRAHRIVAAFEANVGDVGFVDGEAVDRRDLAAARRLLDRIGDQPG